MSIENYEKFFKDKLFPLIPELRREFKASGLSINECLMLVLEGDSLSIQCETCTNLIDYLSVVNEENPSEDGNKLLNFITEYSHKKPEGMLRVVYCGENGVFGGRIPVVNGMVN